MSKPLKKGTFGVFPAKLAEGRSPYEQTILAWLWVHSNNEGKCFPSVTRLAKISGMSKRKADDSLAKLEKDGLIHKTERQGKSNLYEVMACACDAGEGGAQDTRGGACGAGEPPHEVHPNNNKENKTKEPYKLRDYMQVWYGVYGGEMAAHPAAKLFKALEAEHGREAVLDAWKRYCDETEAPYASAGHFASRFGSYAQPKSRLRIIPDGTRL